MAETQKKRTIKHAFKTSTQDVPPEEEKQNKSQSNAAQIKQQKLLREIYWRDGQHEKDMEAKSIENRIRLWLPIGVSVGSAAVIACYFMVLIWSGTHGNNFELADMVLSSIGVSTVGGSLTLVGFMIRGLFKLTSPKVKNSRKINK